MSSTMRGMKSVAEAGLGTARTFLILVGLGGAAWFGHAFYWDEGYASAGSSQGECDQDKRGTASALAAEIGSEPKLHDLLSVSADVGYDETVHAQIASRVAGTVWQVRHRLGETVKRGDVLAIVDSAEVGDAKLDLLQASVAFQLKSERRDRLKHLTDILAGKELIEAEAAYRLAKSARFSAYQRLVNLGFSLSLMEIDGLSEQQLANRLQCLGMPEGDGFEGASYNLIPLIAPFNGTITRCDLVQGESVETRGEVYELADMGSMSVYLHVHQDDVARLKHGMRVEFQSGDGRNVVAGPICWIDSNLDPATCTITARVDVSNPLAQADQSQRLLRAGMNGTAWVSLH